MPSTAKPPTGGTGDLIDTLGVSTAIAVASRAASFRWHLSDNTPPNPFEAPAVSYVVTGHVEREGERLRVRGELLGGPA